MILVTGGTGLVGSHLLYELAQKKDKIKAIYRSKKKIELVRKIFSYYTNTPELYLNKIEWIEADITDIPSLDKAFKNVTHVYHCAAFVSFEPDKYYTLRKINIEGTANVVNICLAKKVVKLCYVSSVAALGESINNLPVNENTDWNSETENSVYSITKYGAEMEIWRGMQEGLDAVIVNPTLIIGPGIWRYGSGTLITKVNKGLNHYTDGSTGLIGVIDVVSCMIELMEGDFKNERYILVSENWSYKKLFNTIAEKLDKNPIEKELKPFFLQILWRIDWLTHKLTGKRRRLPKSMANTIISHTAYDNSKIINALNYTFTPMEKCIKKTCKYFLEDFG
jgi:nucleoside-diphosphate-sugar epimerase